MATVIRGSKWRENVQAFDWVGKAIAQALGLDVEDKKERAKITGLLIGVASGGEPEGG